MKTFSKSFTLFNTEVVPFEQTFKGVIRDKAGMIVAETCRPYQTQNGADRAIILLAQGLMKTMRRDLRDLEYGGRKRTAITTNNLETV